MAETGRTRPISWIKPAFKDFGTFPAGAQPIFLTALTIAAEGGKPDIVKPLHGLGSGVFVATRFASFTLVKDRLKKLEGGT